MLRLDWNLIFNVMNLIILFFILKKFLIGPVTKIMEKRKAIIDEQFQKAKQIEQDAYLLKEQYRTSMEEVKITSDTILEESRKEAQRLHKSIILDAEEKAEKTLIQANDQIQMERAVALRQLQSEIGELSILAASKLVSDNLESGTTAYGNFLKKAGGTYDKSGV